MNIVHLLQILFINTWIFIIRNNGNINLLISPKFNKLTLLASCSVYLILGLVIIQFLFGNLKLSFKIDHIAIIFLILSAAIKSDYRIEVDSLIINKYKGKILADVSVKNQIIEKEKTPIAVNEISQESELEIKSFKSNSVKNFDKTISDSYLFLVPENNISSRNFYRKLNLLEIYRELNDFKNENEISTYNYRVETIGRIYDDVKGYNMQIKRNEFFLMQFVMVCCAADMIPVSIIISNHSAFKIKNNSWARIKGKIKFVKDKETGGFYGIVEDDSIEEISEPSSPYLF